jgi:hypothetical protein
MSVGTLYRVASGIKWLLKKIIPSFDSSVALTPADLAEPLHVLGHEFNSRSNLESLLLFFHSRIWFSYRRGFERLPASDLSTDAGWGCVYRAAQMMLANSLVNLRLGRGEGEGGGC